MAKALKYWYEWKDFEETLFREEIWVEGFVGTAEELKAGSEPLIKTYNKDVGEKYLGGIVPFVVNLSAKSSATFKATEFTGENYGDAILKHKQGSTVLFNAIIVPFEGMDDDLDAGYYKVQLSAECGLNYLKSITFEPTKTRKTLLNIIDVCLTNLPYIDSFGYYVVDNTTTNDGSSTGLNYFDTFIDDRQFTDMNCYDVIKAIIQEYGQFVFADGRWNIFNISNISKENSTYRIYNAAVSLTSSGTYTRPTKTIRRLAGGKFGRLFSQQSVKVEKKASVKRSINSNSELDSSSGWTYNGLADILFTFADGKLKNNGNTYYTYDGATADISYYQSPPSLFYPFTDRFTTTDKEKLKVAIKASRGFNIKNLRLQILAVQNGVLGGASTEVFYLTPESTWYRGVSGYATPFYYLQYEDGKEKVIDIPQVPNIVYNVASNGGFLFPGWGEFIDYPYNVPATNIPYNLYIRVYMPERFHNTYDLAPPTSEFTVDIDYINVSVADVKSEISEGFIKKYGITENKDRDLNFTINLNVGYPSYPIGYDSLFRDDSTTTQISLFNGVKLEEHISNSYLSVLGSRLQFYTGTVQGDLEFSDLVTIDSVKYRLHNLEQNFRTRQHTIKAVSLLSNTDTVAPLEIGDLDIKLDIEGIRKAVDEQLKKTYGNALDIKFVDKNLEVGILGNGQSSLKIKEDFRVEKLTSQEAYLRATDGGTIKDVATNTSGNYILTKPARTGTYALLDDIDALSWKIGGNVVTEQKIFGTTSGNFDIQVLRNNTQVGMWRSGGLTVPNLIGSELTASELVATDSNKKLVSLAVATYPNLTELTYLKGVTSAIQAQITAKFTLPTLTANYVTKSNGTTLSNSQIFDNGTNLGIGTTTLEAKLNITQSVGAFLKLERTGGAILRVLGFNDDTGFHFYVTNNASNVYKTLKIDGGSLLLNTDSGGNVGIGTTSPSYKIDVTGTGHFTGAVTFDSVPSSLVDATTSNHLVRYSQWIASATIKYLPTAVKSVALTNITLSGTQTVSGVALVASDRCLVMGQSTVANNGIYDVAAGSWTRATDSDADSELRGYIVSVSSGTYAGYKYINTNASAITVGSTSITYSEFSNTVETDPIFVSWRDTSRTANTFFSAPNGSNGSGTWRAIVAADIPTLNQNTTGSAATLTTARDIAITGDATYTVSFNGSANVTGALTLATVATAGTYRSVTVNAKGLVTSGTNPTTVAGYGITDITSAVLTGFTSGTGTVADTDTILQAIQKLAGNGDNYVNRSSNQEISGVKTFLGVLEVENDVNIYGRLQFSATSGTNLQVIASNGTVDSWTTLTTSHISNLSSYTGFNSVYQPLDADLTAIAALSGTSGFLKKTAANTWSLDTATYLTTVSLTANVTDILPIANGGTGSSTKNFVDLSTNQTSIGGVKTFNSNINFKGDTIAYTNIGQTDVLDESTFDVYGVGHFYNPFAIILSSNTDSKGIIHSFTDVYTFNSSLSGLLLGTGLNLTNQASERLQVNGNVRYSGTLKPANTTPTTGQFLKADSTSTNAWATITTSDISGISSYLTTATAASTYLTANQTITLSGIVTGSGTTAITTAIANDALTIAMTDGLQTALDAKMPLVTGTIGQVFAYDGSNYNFMNLDHKPLKLSINEIAVGNDFGLLESRSEFTYNRGTLKVANKTDATKYVTFGMISPNGTDALLQVLGGGGLQISAPNVYLNSLGGSTAVERSLVIDQNGKISAKVLDNTGNTIQGLDSVLAVSEVATNRNILLKYTGSASPYFGFVNSSNQPTAFLSHSTIDDQLVLQSNLENGLVLNTSDGDIWLNAILGKVTIGRSGANSEVVISGTSFKLSLANNFSGAGNWGNLGGISTPQDGDVCTLTFDSSEGAFVLSHVKKRTGTYDGTKTYLTVD